MPKQKKTQIVVLEKKGKGNATTVASPSRSSRRRNQRQVKKASPIGSFIKDVGSSLGSFIAGPVGAKVGGKAASYISRIMGQGDYKINENTLVVGNNIPSFSTNGDDVIIRHRELVKDVVGSVAFTNTGYLINPGNTILFPWLSKIAALFQEYKFHGLVFEYKSTSGSAIASTNNALGAVIMATDYDSMDSIYTTKRSMENTEFATSGTTMDSFIHPIECDSSRNVLGKQYVSTSSTITLAQDDPRFYYQGIFQFATGGQQAAVTIGELWVSYQVRLSRPTFDFVSLEPTMNRAIYGKADCDYDFLTGTTSNQIQRNGFHFGDWSGSNSGWIVLSNPKAHSHVDASFSTPYVPNGYYLLMYYITVSSCTTAVFAQNAPFSVDYNGYHPDCIQATTTDKVNNTLALDVVQVEKPPIGSTVNGTFSIVGYYQFKFDSSYMVGNLTTVPFFRLPEINISSGSHGPYNINWRLAYLGGSMSPSEYNQGIYGENKVKGQFYTDDNSNANTSKDEISETSYKTKDKIPVRIPEQAPISNVQYYDDSPVLISRRALQNPKPTFR